MPLLNPNHLNDFVVVLGAITNYMGVNLQQALYREGLVVYFHNPKVGSPSLPPATNPFPYI